jgi:hypothetical protein
VHAGGAGQLGKSDAAEGEDDGAPGSGLSFDEVCAVLVKDPYFLSFDQIARLTDYQLTHILFRPEAASGLPAGGTPVSDFYAYWLLLRRSGNDDAEVLRRWALERKGREAEAVIDPTWKVPTRGEPERTA